MGVVSREIRIGPGPGLAARIAGRAAVTAVTATRSAAVNAVLGINRHVGADGRAAARLRPCAVGRQRLAEIAVEKSAIRRTSRINRQIGGSAPVRIACAVVNPDSQGVKVCISYFFSGDIPDILSISILR